jgi:pilus assembly protein CpaE
MIAGMFHYVVVDASSRLDSATRLASNLSEKILLIAHADVASLWSAGRVAQYLGESGSRDRFALVLNRYRKVGGFNEAETEAAIGAPVLWRIPNQYFVVSTAIDRGVPLMQGPNTEIARSITGLAKVLTKDDLEVKRTTWSLFKTV